MVVTGNWAVYARSKGAPTDGSKTAASKPADTTQKNDTTGNTTKTAAPTLTTAALGNTRASAGSAALSA